MSFRICCPQCGACCLVSDEDVGKNALCGNCDQPIVITETPIVVAREEPSYQPSRAQVATPRVDPVRARALTAPIGRINSGRRRRWGCAVIAMIAAACLVLVLWSMSPMETGRDAARRSQCTNNLKQIVLALHNYHDVHKSFPPPYIADQDGRPMHSWRVLILPFMEEQRLYDRYDFDEPWDGPNNRRLWSEMPDAYRCPATSYADPNSTPYQVVVGENTIFEPGRKMSFADIYDGTANTILVVEAASSPVHWMAPSDVRYSRQGRLPQKLWSSNHGPRGLHVAFADGHVDHLSPNIEYEHLRSLIERLDGVYP